MKKLYALLLFLSFFSLNNLNAQETELTNEELSIESSDPFFINASYGVDGITLFNYFKYCRLKTDTLRLGNDLNFSVLDGSKLAINTALMFPAKFTYLDLDYLKFHAKGTGLGEEEWSIGRSTDGSNPPRSIFKIARFFVYTGGGATYNTALSIDSNLNVALGNIAATQKLDVNGNARFRLVNKGSGSHDLRIASDGTLQKVLIISDVRLKENIRTLDNALNKVMRLRGVSFSWKNDPEAKIQHGFLAQEVMQVVPELVFKTDEYYGLEYQELIGLLVEAVKEQNFIIERQEEKINKQQETIDLFKSYQARLEKLEERVRITFHDE